MTDWLEERFGVPRQARLFPLLPNSKRPAIDKWPLKATNDRKTLERWFDSSKGYNVGVATGHGLIVVDVDVKKGAPGLDSLELLDMEGLPQSLRVRTPSGGLHIYLLTDEDIPNSVNSLDGYPGIDIRGKGGYVVGPGSTIDGEAYTIED